jgi:hypothetical protein
LQIYLPITAPASVSRECSTKAGETVILSDVVQFPVVHEEAEVPILLLDNGGGLPGAV